MNFINKITQSRKIILEMLELRNFNISKYSNFTNNEIDIMLKTSNKKLTSDINCLDMVLEHNENESKCLVKYIIFNKPRPQNLKVIIDELIEIYTRGDTIIFISKDKLNNVNFDLLFDCYKDIFLQIFDVYSLQINISKHILVPKLRILNNDEKKSILEKFGLDDYTQFNIIKINDAQAKFYGVKKNDLVEISRSSETAGIYKVWRYCQ